MSAWVLPDHIADVLPSEARHIEELRRSLLDTARGYGYELVMPPLVEHIDSLLTGTGQALDLQTFKLVDRASGRTLGVRADTTPQVARIDAHLLNRQSITRLCYCGPVLHAHPETPTSTREPLQLGAECYGHAGQEADLEVLSLAMAMTHAVGLQDMRLDVGDVRVVDALLQGVSLTPVQLHELHMAVTSKDRSQLAAMRHVPDAVRHDLIALTNLFGDAQVLEQARAQLSPSPALFAVLDEIKALLEALSPTVPVHIDLADLSGYQYYTGLRFQVLAKGPKSHHWSSWVRGGRYDHVGSVFGRKRPAVGFSLDLKTWAMGLTSDAVTHAIWAPLSTSQSLRLKVSELRALGHTVVCLPTPQTDELDEFVFEQGLQHIEGQWTLVPMGQLT